MGRKGDIRKAIEDAGFKLEGDNIVQDTGDKPTTYGVLYKGHEKGDGLFGTWYADVFSMHLPPEETARLRTALGPYLKSMITAGA